MDHCLKLAKQFVSLALRLAFARAGKSRPARIAMMAITTSNSINVNAPMRTDGKERKMSLEWSRDITLRLTPFFVQNPSKSSSDAASHQHLPAPEQVRATGGAPIDQEPTIAAVPNEWSSSNNSSTGPSTKIAAL